MPGSRPSFQPGAWVQRTNQPEEIGCILEVRADDQAESWNYEVQFGAQVKIVPEEHLRAFVPARSIWDNFLSSTFSGAEHFAHTLTFHRLRCPPARIAFSFSSSRTVFYPHQFKPLLKFLDNPDKRLLIADDVGLGKTIEAGYILRELEAQQVVERVLVLVPARLASKWQRELQSRFGESFDVVRRGELERFTSRWAQGREPEPFRWIVSYETARAEEIREGFAEVRPPIDILIADEAHRMRNPETLQHKLGRTLCDCADTVVFLSATPVQTTLDDLWNLMRLLSPEEYADRELFRSLVESNRFLLAAQRSLLKGPNGMSEAARYIGEFLETEPGRHQAGSSLVKSILDRLRSGQSGRRQVVELQADIALLSPIGRVLTRTRKAEAMPERPRRRANWYEVRLTEEEQEFYDSVEELCRQAWTGDPRGWGFHMSLLMAYRAVASCIPAAVQYFADKLRSTQPAAFSDEFEEGEDEEPEDKVAETSAWSGRSGDRLRKAVGDYREKHQQTDSKLARLLEALALVWGSTDGDVQPRRKVVVFSYFRRTVEYLATALTRQGIQCRRIHGGLSVDVREKAIDEFLDDKDVSVLVTSDVGGEGIDLQCASVLVNYDLPWNPMVVEQRIGRLDRIGQTSKEITILNLVVSGSVEERILKRLLDRIKIFEESIGEIDPIIGEKIRELTQKALLGDPADKQLLEELNEQELALAKRVRDAQAMLSRIDGMLAADQGLIDEINAVIGERQIPSDQHLLLFLNSFLRQSVPGCQIPREAIKRAVTVDLRGLSTLYDRRITKTDPEAVVLGRRIATGPLCLTLSRDVAYRHHRVELLHIGHPLVRFAVGVLESARQHRCSAFALRLPQSSVLDKGGYAFLVSLVTLKGHRTMSRFATVICALDGEGLWTDPDVTTAVTIEMLDCAENTVVPELSDGVLRRAKERLVRGMARLTAEWNKHEAALDRARQELQRATLSATLELRVRRAAQRLKDLEEKGGKEFAVRMARYKLEKAQQEMNANATARRSSTWQGVEQEEVAVGILVVEKRRLP